MGLYVNPTNDSKEHWLLANLVGKPYPKSEATLWLNEYDYAIANGKIPVVLVYNGSFTALGVAFSKNEAVDFTNPADERPMIFTVVPREALANPNSGVGERLLNAFKL